MEKQQWIIFGFSLTMSDDGNIIAIGGINNNGSSNAEGHVRAYEWDGLSWNQKGNDIDGEASGDMSGYSISMSNDGNNLPSVQFTTMLQE